MPNKLKVLLIQLPLPQYSLRKEWGNVPLAAGYLKAVCYKTGLLDKADIDILDERNSNLAGDAKLIDLIVSKTPDILGFSLYCWNSIRSLYIAEEIKGKLPDVEVIVGGAEVTLDSNYILDNSVIDIGCMGEGEFAFAEIVSHILHKKKDFNDINGIFYRKNDKIMITPQRPMAEALDKIPSPYVLGIINPKDYGNMCIETRRGCPFKCTYCHERTRPLHFRSPGIIESELKLAIELGIEDVTFLDSCFNTLPNFKELYHLITKVNRNGKLRLSGAVNAEFLTEEAASMLKECGFTSVEVGLQSINPVVLKNINRPTNIKRFIDGIDALKKRHIDFVIDLIIGLPGETLQSFEETIKFLKDKGLVAHINPFKLAILPGTKLKSETDKYGIKYQERPPYLASKSSSLSESDIKECHKILNKFIHRKTIADSRPYPIEVPMTSYLRTDYPLRKNLHKKHLSSMNIARLNFPITKIIVELDTNKQNLTDIDSLAKRLKRKVANSLTVWFISQDIESDFKLITSFLKSISISNPYLVWNVFLETRKEFDLSIIDRIKKSVNIKDAYMDSPVRIFSIFSFREDGLGKEWLDELAKIIPCFWYIEFAEKNNWDKELEQILRENDKLFLADFYADANVDFIADVFNLIRERKKDDYFLFKNSAVNHLVKKEGDFVRYDVPVSKKINECILRFDKELQLSSCVLPNAKSMTDMIFWKHVILKEAGCLASYAK
jgi:radical SAM superfamily enzyme YgiQ (UPF0313 family)